MSVFSALLRIALLALLVTFIAAPQVFAPVFEPLTSHGAPAIYNQGSLVALTLSHLWTVFVATLGSIVVAVSLGIFVTRPSGLEFLPLSRTIVNVGQTFPPVAVLAIAVPLVGFGEAPTLIALFLYGLLPIFENTLTGLTQVSPLTLDAARGMGMNARRRLVEIELPLALPVILAGIRLSLVINLSTATIGSTVAAKGLGEVIIAGLQSNNTAFVVQGGLVVAMLAFFIHDAFRLIERRAGRYQSAQASA
ncbi:ABC transporter permease [Microvirga flavescens]|uniref:ABC transporter permease n=1 Tax=Microvirga flavescens TaxID=2249811 RepID=UPI000DD72C9F|nr:ABC transporter permease [Microvirga flavescens]